MTLFHKIGLFITGFVLRTSLFLGFTLLAAVMVFGNRNTIKQALFDSNAYERYSQSIIDAGKRQAAQDPNAIPLDDPNIDRILKDSLDPKSLSTAATTVVDASYDWLDGSKKQLSYSVDLSPNKKRLARGISDYAVARLAQLPPCSAVPSETNVFRLACYPITLNANQARQQIYDALMKDTSIFPNHKLTETDLPKTSDGSPLTVAYKNAPLYFSIFKKTPWILFGLAAVCALAVVSLSRTRRQGLRMVATSLLGMGVILAIAPILYTYVLPALGFSLPGIGGSQDESISLITNDIMKQLYTGFNTTLINLAVQAAVAGLILYLLLRYIKVDKSPYANVKKKAGLALSIDNSNRPTGPKINASTIPVQTSERPGKTKKNTSALEKRFKRL